MVKRTPASVAGRILGDAVMLALTVLLYSAFGAPGVLAYFAARTAISAIALARESRR